MKITRGSLYAAFVALLVLAVGAGLPALAQESDDDDQETGKFLRVFFEVGAWLGQPSGTEFGPATRLDPADPFGAELLEIGQNTETSFRGRVGVALRGNRGSIVATYYSTNSSASLEDSLPGEFVFGEVLAHPLYAGVNNDGLADGFSSASQVQLRDIRVDYARIAFRGRRLTGQWFVGYRTVTFDRKLEAEYFALVSGLPPLIPPLTNPRPDLDPGVDQALVSSNYNGRGIEGGMDFRVPLAPKIRLSLEAGFLVAVLRGKTDTSYSSTNHYYVTTDQGEDTLLFPPYDEFEELETVGNSTTPVVNRIEQRSSDVGLTASGRSTTGDILEAYIGLRWQAVKNFDVFAGWRSASYGGSGVELRPSSYGTTGGVNLVDVTERDRSVTYEGYYFGVSYLF